MQDKVGQALEVKEEKLQISFVKTVVKDDGDAEEV